MALWNSTWIRLLLLGIGIAFLLLFVDRLGWQNVVFYLREMKIEFVFILLIASGWYLLNCLAWEQFLEARKARISLWRLFQIKVAGEAINTATPLSFAGGDPLRIAFIRRFFSGREGAASVVLDRTIHSLATALMMGLGAILAIGTLSLSQRLRIGLLILLGVLFAALVIAIFRQHRGLFVGIVAVLDFLGLGKWIRKGVRQKLGHIDEQIQYFYRSGKLRFYASIFFHVLGRLLGVLEIYAIAAFLDIHLNFLNSYFLAMLGALINIIFVFVPGSMGVMEGAYGGLFHVLSLDPAGGIALQLVRRIRSFVWIGIGFFFIYAHHRDSD